MDEKGKKCRSPVCAWVNPDEADFCMKCGRKLVVRDRTSWSGMVLTISETADLTSFISAVWKDTPEEERPTSIPIVNLRWVFDQYLYPKRRQIAIRLWGLDGCPPRTSGKVRKEWGVKHYSTVLSHKKSTLATLRQPIVRGMLTGKIALLPLPLRHLNGKSMQD